MKTKLKYDVASAEGGLKKTVDWYLNNKWWEPLIHDRFFTEDEP